MDNWWNQIQRWFAAESDHSSSKRPLLHEPLERSEDFLAAYHLWRQGKEPLQLINFIWTEFYEYVTADKSEDEHLIFMMNGRAAGFVWYLQNQSEAVPAQFFIDFLRDGIKEMGYIQQLGDVRHYFKSEKHEIAERHYLKYRFTLDDQERFEQRYGNITIEYVNRSDQPLFICMQVVPLADRKYNPSQPFEDMLKRLVEWAKVN